MFGCTIFLATIEVFMVCYNDYSNDQKLKLWKFDVQIFWHVNLKLVKEAEGHSKNNRDLIQNELIWVMSQPRLLKFYKLNFQKVYIINSPSIY